MAVFRVHKTKDFTVMSNYHLRDKNLTLKAKGLLSVILSLPDDWKYSIAGLASICKEGTSAVKSALQELTGAGYVTVTKLYPNQTETGRIEYAYDIHETPQASRKQGIENLPLESQQVENQGQLNTDVPSTDKPNTKDKTKKEDKDGIPFSEIIDYLNEKAHRRYRPTTPKTREHIRARWNEGYTLDDFKHVIDVKCAEWLGDPKMDKYLCPDTLFGTKFEKYLNQPMPSGKNFSSQRSQDEIDLSAYEDKTGTYVERDGKQYVYVDNEHLEEVKETRYEGEEDDFSF